MTNYKLSALADFCSFFLLGVQLFTVNCILLTQMNGFVQQTKVKNLLQREKNFLIWTLCFFAGSYILSTARNVVMFMLFSHKTQADMP